MQDNSTIINMSSLRITSSFCTTRPDIERDGHDNGDGAPPIAVMVNATTEFSSDFPKSSTNTIMLITKPVRATASSFHASVLLMENHSLGSHIAETRGSIENPLLSMLKTALVQPSPYTDGGWPGASVVRRKCAVSSNNVYIVLSTLFIAVYIP
jgi:hypothetical protein